MDKSVLSNNDLILWQEFCQGKEASFEQLVRRYYPKMYRYGTRIWPDDPIVRDCIQEIFTDLWMRKEQLMNVTSVNFYLISATRNRLYFEKRKKRSMVDLADWAESDVFINEFTIESDLIIKEDQKQQLARLNSLLNALPSRQREVIHLRFFIELEHEQIAELMGLNKQSVYNLLHETIRRLRNMWFLLLFLIF